MLVDILHMVSKGDFFLQEHKGYVPVMLFCWADIASENYYQNYCLWNTFRIYQVYGKDEDPYSYIFFEFSVKVN